MDHGGQANLSDKIDTGRPRKITGIKETEKKKENECWEFGWVGGSISMVANFGSWLNVDRWQMLGVQCLSSDHREFGFSFCAWVTCFAFFA